MNDGRAIHVLRYAYGITPLDAAFLVNYAREVGSATWPAHGYSVTVSYRAETGRYHIS